MRRFSPATFCAGALLTFCMALGAMLCPITAFGLDCDLKALALGCAAFAAVFSLLFTFRRAWIGVLLLVPLLLAGLYLHWDAVLEALSLAVNVIGSEYALALGIYGSYVFLPGVPQAQDGIAFFLAAAGLVSFLCAWCTVRMRSPSLCALAVLPFLILCLIILETVPSVWAVLLTVGPLLVLILTHQIRERDLPKASKMALWIATPMALLLIGLVLLFPPEDYERSDWPDELREGFNELVSDVHFLQENEQTGQMEFVSLFSPVTLGSWSWDSSVEKADLTQVGPMRKSTQHVMRVRTDHMGVLYLRGSSLTEYDGQMWLALEDESLEYLDLEEGCLADSGSIALPIPSYTVDVSTGEKSGICYLPYYTTALPDNMIPVGDAYFKNRLRETEYSVEYVAEGGYGAEEDYAEFVREAYLELPEETREGLRMYLNALPVPDVMAMATTGKLGDSAENMAVNLSESSIVRLAGELAELVQSGKTYHLDTPKAPSGSDFALWFLNESDTGYCVHFATATTLLLRYCGVPARYVTGYMTTISGKTWTPVTAGEAHAWVEYYIDGVGWRLLEATPAGEAETEFELPNEETPEIKENDPEIPNEIEEEPEPTKPTDPEKPGQPEDPEKPETPSPSGQSGGGEAEATIPSSVWIAVLCALGVLALTLGWRLFVLGARKRQFSTGVSNRRAVMLYRHIARLARFEKKAIPEELTALALRAKYSQHRLSEDEVLTLQHYADAQTAALLQTRNVWRQFQYRIILVLK